MGSSFLSWFFVLSRFLTCSLGGEGGVSSLQVFPEPAAKELPRLIPALPELYASAAAGLRGLRQHRQAVRSHQARETDVNARQLFDTRTSVEWHAGFRPRETSLK